MSKMRRRWIYLSLFVLNTGGSLHAYVADTELEAGLVKGKKTQAIEEKVLRLQGEKIENYQESDEFQNLEVLRDTKTGSIRLLHGFFEDMETLNTTDPSAFVEASKRYINNHKEIFGIDASQVQELPSALYIGKDEQFVRFHVYRDGIRIKDASVDFRFKFGKLLQISNQSFAEASFTPTEEVSNLLDKAEDLVNAKVITPLNPVYRVVEVENGYTLEKVASFSVVSENDLPYSLELDTKTGKIHELNRAFYNYEGSVQGDMYPRWYDEQLTSSPFRFLDVQTSKGEVRSNTSGIFTADADASPQLSSGLKGQYVTVKDIHNAHVTSKAVLNGDAWVLRIKKEGSQAAWMDTRIAQNMIYDKATAIIERAKKYIDSPWFARSLVANANLDSHCNAYWDGNTINLFSGNDQCANTGLIADVVYHEWGHGLHHNAEGIEDGALSEGYGDILSLIMTHSNLLGIGFHLSNRGPVRDIKPAHIYPRDRGEVHSEGMIIASTFWELFDKLRAKYGEDKAGDMLANYAFKMIFTARTYLDVYRVLLVIDSNGGDPAKGTPNQCLLNEVFFNHGLTTKDAACELAAIDEWSMNGSSNTVLKPGMSVNIQLKAKNASPDTLTDLKGKITVKNLPGVEIENTHLIWGSIPTGASVRSENSVRMDIPSNAVCGSSFQTIANLTGHGKELSLTKDWTLGRNEGSAANMQASGLPLPIRDLKTTTVTIKASDASWKDSTKVMKAELNFKVKHSYLGDLIVTLKAPDGSSERVYKGTGRGPGHYTFQADISEKFKGKKISGDWSLEVRDTASGDEGTVESASLVLTPALFNCK